MSEALVAKIDKIRYSDPHEAIRLADAALESEMDWHSIVRILGVKGSTHRLLAQSSKSLRELQRQRSVASCSLKLGLKIARRFEDYQAIGDLLLRLFSLEVDGGKYARAYAICRGATDVFSFLGDLTGIGKTLVNRGICLFYLGDMRGSKKKFEAAIGMLPAQEERHRFAAYINLAATMKELGMLPEALNYYREALGFSAYAGIHRANLLWHFAEIARKLGRMREAKEAFSAAIDLFIESSPIDAALTVTQLISLLLEMGEISEARSVAKGIMRLLIPLQRHPVASAAIGELARIGLDDGELTSELIAKLCANINEERARLSRARRSFLPVR